MRIVEVGPRDGLQNETARVPSAVKIAFIDALSQSGVAEIEVSAFVSPRWVPQLGDAADVFAGLTRREGVTYSALVPNRKGFDQALAAGAHKVAVFTAVSETFNRKNINTSIDGSINRFLPIVAAAALVLAACETLNMAGKANIDEADIGHIKEGQRVEFDVVEGPKGPQAQDVVAIS